MTPKKGQYFYLPYCRLFRIYRYETVEDGFTLASPVSEEPYFFTREEAGRRVRELNGRREKP